jgi:hypothetical protein
LHGVTVPVPEPGAALRFHHFTQEPPEGEDIMAIRNTMTRWVLVGLLAGAGTLAGCKTAGAQADQGTGGAGSDMSGADTGTTGAGSSGTDMGTGGAGTSDMGTGTVDDSPATDMGTDPNMGAGGSGADTMGTDPTGASSTDSSATGGSGSPTSGASDGTTPETDASGTGGAGQGTGDQGADDGTTGGVETGAKDDTGGALDNDQGTGGSGDGIGGQDLGPAEGDQMNGTTRNLGSEGTGAGERQDNADTKKDKNTDEQTPE